MLEKLKADVPETLPEGKDRFVYTLLAFLLGSYGVHKLWAGGAYAEKGKMQLIVGLVGSLCLCGLPNLYTMYTAIKDASVVK